MAQIPSPPSMLLHPVPFAQNLIRAAKIVTHTHTAVPVERKSDGLVVEMRKPLNPDGHFPPFLSIPAPRPLAHTRFTLPAGHTRKPHNLALPCAIEVEKDLAIPMRDGVKIYADVYRPAPTFSADGNEEGEKVPAIMAWGPYGKEGNSELFLDKLPERLGVEREQYSGYENFEGPDPAFWCARGYAIVNVDTRGSWNSEGDLYFWGKNDEQDGYDAIEFLARQPWCTGKIGMAGNSWLAISQWFIASAQPPHLAAIAPWEGLTDTYRDQARRGGAPEPTMSHAVGLLIPGRALQEDHSAMTEKRELWDAYWEDKRVKLARVRCPAYVVGSYSSKLHAAGSVRGWREAGCARKWVRIHSRFEWADWLGCQGDLALFFDCFLKGARNKWPETPPVRLSLLTYDPALPPVVDRPYATYPPPSMRHQTYFLDPPTETAVPSPVPTACTTSYRAADMRSEIHFDVTFPAYTELAGYPKVTLYMSTPDGEDMDVYVLLQKLDREGRPVTSVNYPATLPHDKLPEVNVVQYQGPTGFLRASHRAIAPPPSYAGPIDATAFGPGSAGEVEVEWDGRRELFHPHLRPEPVGRGEVVGLEFTTWPIGCVYEAGEGVRVRICGRDMCFVEAAGLPVNKTRNKGTHVLHAGGGFGSCIMLPVISGGD